MVFEIIKNDEGLPCRIIPFGNESSMIGLHNNPAHLGVSVVARKCGPPDGSLTWNIEIDKVLHFSHSVYILICILLLFQPTKL